MKIINAQQGTDQWLAIRASHFTASEAPAMLGLSKYMSRAELLRQKATGITAEVDSFKQAAFDRGHEAEAVARPLAEAYLQEDLYPCTGSLDVDGLQLLASFDGLSMDESTVWENKLHSDSLAAMLDRAEIDGTYWPQLEMQLLVSGATRALFTTCDGEKIVKQRWYESQPERRAQLLAGWHQFAEDLKTYTPPEIIPAAVAAPQEQLPALTVVVSGSVAVRDNLAVFGDALRAYIDGINRKPETDNDFATIKAASVRLREVQTRLASAKESMLGQLADVDTVRRAAEDLEELARGTAIELEKIHEAETKNRKSAIIEAGKKAAAEHIASLNARIGKPYMPAISYDFAGKTKGLRTLTSYQDAVDTELARVKIEANSVADRIDANLKVLRELAADHAFLFADTATIVQKATDDLTALVKSRIAEHKESEAKRLEAERAKIRAEEEAKAAAKVRAEQEEAERKATAEAADEAARIAAKAHADQHSADPMRQVVEYQPVTPVVHSIPVVEDTGRTLNLGEINAALGFTVSTDFLDALGFKARTEKNARLYRQCDFPRICAAIARHCDAVAAAGMQVAE
jgi:predicted phage-related endonuclease